MPPTWWVRLAECATLAEAFDVVRGYKSAKPPVRIIPHWNARDGMLFAVVLWNYFYDEALAVHQLAQLPSGIDVTAKVAGPWEGDTVFFSNPYLGKGHR